MYDINKFLENRTEILNKIECLQFRTDSVGDHDFDDLCFSIEVNGHSLYVEASIKETLTGYSPETRDSQGSWDYERELESVDVAHYVDSEFDDIPCTENEIKVIENVIKSLL